MKETPRPPPPLFRGAMVTDRGGGVSSRGGDGVEEVEGGCLDDLRPLSELCFRHQVLCGNRQKRMVRPRKPRKMNR